MGGKVRREEGRTGLEDEVAEAEVSEDNVSEAGSEGVLEFAAERRKWRFRNMEFQGSIFLARTLCCLCARRAVFAFCSQVRRGSMLRRGWSSLPVPDWFEVIWGPRPPSVQWPHQQKGKGKGVAPTAAPRGRWRNPDRSTRAPAQTRRDPPKRRSPEEVVSAAQERVQKLERALEVLGEDSGPEFQVLQNSLKKATAAAQGVPLGDQLEQSLKFAERSEKRLQVLDEERAKEARLLEEAKQRVARLRSELAAESHRSKPTLANPTLARPTLANVKVLVVCKDLGFSESIVWVF